MHTWIRMKMNIYNIYTVCLPVLVSIDDNRNISQHQAVLAAHGGNVAGRGVGGDQINTSQVIMFKTIFYVAV